MVVYLLYLHYIQCGDKAKKFSYRIVYSKLAKVPNPQQDLKSIYVISKYKTFVPRLHYYKSPKWKSCMVSAARKS